MAGTPVSIALDIKDPLLADRLAALLGGVSGLRLVAPGEPADALITTPESKEVPPDELGLTPREQEVLTLLNKFDAIGRTDAVAHAARLGVLQL